MKKFEVVIRGEHEAEIGHEILSGIYAAIQNYGYTDVSVQADTIEEQRHRELQIPEFLKPQQKGIMERSSKEGVTWQEMHHSQVSRGCGGLPRVRS